jgi:hypothetical protein
MPEEGSNVWFGAYADRFYLDRANKDSWLYRYSAATIGVNSGLLVPYLTTTGAFSLQGGNIADDVTVTAGKTIDGVDISAHAADIDAHQYDALMKVLTGASLLNDMIVFYSSVSPALATDRICATPFYLPRDMTFDQVVIMVKTADAGKNIRLGVYNDGTNLYPGTLAKDFGAVSVNATGVITTTITDDLSLTKGLYWKGSIAENTGADLYCSPIWLAVLGVSETNLTQVYVGYNKDSVSYGALPDPFTSGASKNVTPSAQIQYYLRPKSLD